MTEREMLLTMLAEECAEVAQRVSKCLRFSTEEIQPGQNLGVGIPGLNNGERVAEEMRDLIVVYGQCVRKGYLPRHPFPETHKLQKLLNIKKWMQHSRDNGTLEAGVTESELNKSNREWTDIVDRFKDRLSGMRKGLSEIIAICHTRTDRKTKEQVLKLATELLNIKDNEK